MDPERSAEAVEKALGKPVSAELSENGLKVRRNLLVLSLVSIVVVIGGVQLDPTSTIPGFKFIGLTHSLVRIGLFLTTSYLFLHFLWYAFDSFFEWRIRITGTRLAFITGARFTSEHGDYPDDPRQSTLYSWWIGQARAIGNLNQKISAIDEGLKPLEDKIRAAIGDDPKGINLNNVLKAIAETNTALADLKRSVDQVQQTLSSQRIPESLKRFDSCFQFFVRSQNLRWLMMDILVPLLFGAAALFLLVKDL